MKDNGLGRPCGGKEPLRGTAGSEGLCPKMPQNAAGTLIDPPMSLPNSSGARPAATAAAPPVLPPGERAWSHGVTARPQIGLFDCQSARKGGVFVVPVRTAPPAKTRCG